jgi:predicted nucleic acid-binding protein
MAAKNKVFLDTDIALDHLTGRLPFAEFAHRVLALAELGEIEVCVSALSFANSLLPVAQEQWSRRGCRAAGGAAEDC